MRVLVTGASGFLGRFVVEALLERGHDVSVLLRPAADAGALPFASKVEIARGDLRSGGGLEAALEGVDAIVHAAAQVLGDPVAQFQGTVLGTERLLGAMAESPVRRLVLVSTLSVYDWEAPRGALDEDSPLERSLYARDGYAVAKTWQERLCREHCRERGVELVVMRPGFIWGPGREWIDGVGMRLGRLVFVNGPFRRLPLTYVENCATALAQAVDADAAAGETLNVFDSDDVRAFRFGSDYVAREGGGFPIPYPYHLGLGVALLASAVARMLFGRSYKLPGILIPLRYRARFRSLRFPNERLRRVLGWAPRHGYTGSLARSRALADAGGP